MFLSELKENQKELFLQLCVHAATSNGEFVSHEKDAIDDYCREMNYKFDPNCDVMELDYLLKEIVKVSSPTERNIIAFEIVALILADSKLDDMESSLLSKITSAFSLTDECVNSYVSLITQYTNIYDSICREVIV